MSASYFDGIVVDWGRLRSDCERDGLAIVAYRLAVERLSRRSFEKPIPTPKEIHIAAREIVERIGGTWFVPTPKVLAEEVRWYGVPVLHG